MCDAMTGLKRVKSEFENLGNISPVKAAKVHGFVTKMSPMKASSSGSNYFVGELADESRTIRVVGFNKQQQQTLAEYQGKEQAIVVDNCEIKSSRGSGKIMEMIVKQSSTVDVSPKKIVVPSRK